MRFIKLLRVSAAIFSCVNIAYAIPNTDHPVTNLGPSLQGSYLSSFYNNNHAFAVLGEVGLRHLRGNLTFGTTFTETQRAKLSVDLLRQKITYPFFSGNTNEWMNQFAIGGVYQWGQLETSIAMGNLSIYYSHARSKRLATQSGTYLDTSGIEYNFTNYRRIAGSNAIGAAPGVIISPWQKARLELDLNYDHVRYDTQYSNTSLVDGFGGSVYLEQAFLNHVQFNLGAEIRKPFNNYQAGLMWLVPTVAGTWNVGLQGNYNVGKSRLPDTYNILLTGSFALDTIPFQSAASPRQFSITEFVRKPAVYMPQVLAIPDESVVTSIRQCQPGAPALIGTLADLDPVLDVTTVDTAAAFSGSNLNYSITTTPSPAPNVITVDPLTGVITISPSPFTDNILITINVTAANACGSATTSFTVFIPASL